MHPVLIVGMCLVSFYRKFFSPKEHRSQGEE